MNKVIKITENQYNTFVNGSDLRENKSIIDEALHYPKFLDKVKFETEVAICNYVSDMIKNNKDYMEKEFNLHYNLYLNKITFKITLNYNQDIDDKKLYGGHADSDERLTTDNKLNKAFLNLIFPVSDSKKINQSKISYIVSHEINHLYDDWNDLLRGGNGIFTNRKNIENIEFLEQNIDSNNKLLKNIAWVCYMSLYTESNAFTVQLMSELRNMKCNYSNVKEKFKETVAYNNLKGIEKDLFSELASSSEYGLFLTNNFIISHYRKTSAPKLNIEQFDADRYKQMLSKWAERTLYRITKRYYGVVQLYCDELTEIYTKNNCILVH